jgi:hypothetical protein
VSTGERQPGTVAKWAVGGLIVLAVLVAALVARSSPSHPFVEITPQRSVPPLAASSASVARSGSEPTGKPAPAVPGGGHFDWITTTLAVLLFVLIVMFLWGRRLRFKRRKRERDDLIAGPAAEFPPEEQFAPEELAEAVDEGLATIERGPVSEAIIACWVRVEDAAEQAGMALRATETSTEFVDRVLGSHGVREPLLRRLSSLYREARFSAHTMTEQSRSEARECLREISSDLVRAVAPETTP